MVERRTLAGLTIVVVACLALRGAHIVFELQSPAEPFESEKIARNLVEGRGYSYTYWGKRMPTAGAPPGLVFVLAALYGTGVPEPDTVFRFLQAGLAAASLVLMWWLAARAFDQRVAWLAAGLFLFDLNLSFSVTWVQETALNIFLTLAGLCSLVWLSDRPRLGRAAVCGLVFGLGMLVRPTTGAIFAAGLAWFTLTATRSAKGAQNRLQAGSSPRAQTPPGPAARFKAVGVAVAVAVLVLAPWTLRNYLVFGRFIPVSQNLGLSLWYGYNPRATGSQVDV
ncbi:MAG: ArnT family glycosyltransferase, partial [Pirellulales bacterium]